MNNLDRSLFEKINKTLTTFNLKELRTVSLLLSKKYKQKKYNYFASDKQRLAYIACRMPAIFVALIKVLKEINITFPNINIKDVLDLGCGPATAAWAMFSIFESIKKMHLIEKDSIINLGKTLLKDEKFFKNLSFEQKNLLKIKNYDYDIVCLSYVAIEFKKPFIKKTIHRWAYSNSKIIIFLEPGTREGFKNIKYIRQNLIKVNVKIIAPCPNEFKCPVPKRDWCHFFVRVQRSKIHKYLKKGSLAYEDEKFSYVIATKMKIENNYARILKKPKKNKNEILFTLCTDGIIKEDIIMRKDTKKYKILEKLKWGDRFDF